MTKVLWFTGLSGSGKTTIANHLAKEFECFGKNYKVFDGDVIRSTLHKNLGFTPEDIKENNKLIIDLCKKELNNFEYLLVPIISPFRKSRDEARRILGKGFIEIYVNCSYDECKKRDVKGLYRKAEKGGIENFIGLHVPYEAPNNPEIIINTSSENIKDSIRKIWDYLDLPKK